MAARRFHLLPWLLLAATGASAQEGDARWMLLPDAPAQTVSGPLQRLISVRAPEQGFTPTEDRRSRGFLSVEAGSGLSLLCDSSFGVGAALADLEQHCLLGRLDQGNWTLGRVDQLAVTRSLSLEDQGLPIDLDFGLAWLRGEPAADDSAGFDLLDPRYAPSAGLAEDLAGESLHVGATHWLSERSWLRVTGRGSRFRAERLLPSGPLAWNSRSLRLDAGVGDFAGSLTGRQTAIPQLNRSWFDLDVGVSWRTPWSGRLTVGARNLLSPADALNAESAKPGEPLVESRTPYVRYQQDL